MAKSTGVTPMQSKEARRELGLSQKNVIEATGLNAYKLKLFEARNFDIGPAASKKLREFYEAQGVDFDQIDAHLSASQRAASQVPPASRDAGELKAGFTHTPRPGFRISDALPDTLVDKLMDRMEANDDRIGELTEAAFKPGFLGGISDDTEAKARELIGALAENHVIFRFLQGRNIIAPTRDEPKTIANYLAQLMQDSPALPLLQGDTTAGVAKPKASKARDLPNADDQEGVAA